jgi:hypothetical protein
VGDRSLQNSQGILRYPRVREMKFHGHNTQSLFAADLITTKSTVCLSRPGKSQLIFIVPSALGPI